jgi:hypothetical protein
MKEALPGIVLVVFGWFAWLLSIPMMSAHWPPVVVTLLDGVARALPRTHPRMNGSRQGCPHPRFPATGRTTRPQVV